MRVYACVRMRSCVVERKTDSLEGEPHGGRCVRSFCSLGLCAGRVRFAVSLLGVLGLWSEARMRLPDSAPLPLERRGRPPGGSLKRTNRCFYIS